MTKLGIVLVTYNRLAYTKRTLSDLLSTLQIPYEIVVVDNGSTDGTTEYIADMMERHPELDMIMLGENRYPGAATNIGWSKLMAADTEGKLTHLMRCDNDMRFSYGWDYVALGYFHEFPRLGQLGLDARALDVPDNLLAPTMIKGQHMTMYGWPGSVGGTCIIPVRVFNEGFRYDETPWHSIGDRPTPQEDCKLSIALQNAGYIVAHGGDRMVRTTAWDGGGAPPEDDDLFDAHIDYYRETMAVRGYAKVHPWLYGE